MIVLIVDDDPKYRFLLRRLLEKKFFATIAEADDGRRGIELLKKWKADIIFLDYEMPVMNGKQFLEILRLENKDIPVAIMTSHREKELFQELIPFGITDYIIKADMVHELAERIGQIFSKSRHLISKKL